MTIHLIPPRRHSGEGRNPGREAGEVKEWLVLSDGASGYRSCVLSFPLAREWLV